MNATTLLDQRWRDVARRTPEALALCGDVPTLTYGALDAAIDRAAGTLLAQGVAPGDRVALHLPKGLAFVLLHLANLRLGSVTVPLNTSATDAEIDTALADCRAALLVTGAGRAEPRLTASATTGVLACDRHATFEAATPPPTPPAAPAPDDLACLLYTSGTTGQPKGARLTQRALAANNDSLFEAWGWSSDDVLLHVLPLFHVHGLFVALQVALRAGARTLLVDGFDATDTWQRLAAGDVTLFMGVPTMYHRLLARAPSPPPDVSSVRLFVSGSAPLRDETARDFEALTGQRILERYGMTEVGMAASNPRDGERRIGTVGPALPGVELRVVDRETGAPAPAGAVGEVQIRGPAVCDGYWERPEATAGLFADGGWLRSGDLGHLDPDGYLTLVGRARELVITGGLNVYPKEVEAVLASHPDVAEAAVAGEPDDDFGEAVVAFLVPAHAGAPTDRPRDADLVAFCKQHLAPYKVPKRFAWLHALPRNAMGKVVKAKLPRTDGAAD